MYKYNEFDSRFFTLNHIFVKIDMVVKEQRAYIKMHTLLWVTSVDIKAL